MAAVVSVVAGGGLFLIGLGADGVRAHYAGIEGTVSVVDCQWESTRRGGGWQCWGAFTSADGAVRIASVKVNPWLDEIPEEPVPARVSSDSASTARALVREYQWLQQVLAGLFMAGLAVYSWRSYRRDDEPGTAGPLTRLRARAAGFRPATASPLTPSTSGAVRTAPPIPATLVPAPPQPPAAASRRSEPPRGHRRMPGGVLLTYVVLLATSVAFVWSVVAWNRSQDAVLSGLADAEVIATQLGPDQRVKVQWPDQDGVSWVHRLTPRAPDAFAVGDVVALRYDPANQLEPRPVDAGAFELTPRSRNVWSGVLLVLGGLLTVGWAWRLGRWALGTLRGGRPVTVQVMAALPAVRSALGPAVVAGWLQLRQADGTVRYQRALWSRELVDLAEANSAEPPKGPNATARPCPGLRQMMLVDPVAGGRIWPAGAARARRPSMSPLESWGPSTRELVGRSLRATLPGLAALGMLPVLAWWLVGPAGVVHLAAIAVAGWLFLGGTPWFRRGAPRTTAGPRLRLRTHPPPAEPGPNR